MLNEQVKKADSQKNEHNKAVNFLDNLANYTTKKDQVMNFLEAQIRGAGD